MDFPNFESLKDKLRFGKEDKRTTLILTIGILLVILAAHFYLLVRPAVAKIRTLTPKVARKNTELKKALKDVSDRSAIENNKSRLKTKIDYYEKKLPTEKEIPKLLEGLSDMAAETGVKIIGIKPVKSSEPEKPREDIYQAQPIAIDAKCGYHELGKFLQNLETGDRIIKTSDVEITADVSSITAHNVKLLVTAYTLTKGK